MAVARPQRGLRASALIVGGVLLGWNLSVLFHHHAAPATALPARVLRARAPRVALPAREMPAPPAPAQMPPGAVAGASRQPPDARCRGLLELQGTVGFDDREWAESECSRRLLLQRTSGSHPT
jgi:hypothetical protein